MISRPDYGVKLSELFKNKQYEPSVLENIHDHIQRAVDTEIAGGHIRVNHEEKRVSIYTEPFLDLLKMVALTLPVGERYEVALATGTVGHVVYQGDSMGTDGIVTFDSSYVPIKPLDRVTVHQKFRI